MVVKKRVFFALEFKDELKGKLKIIQNQIRPLSKRGNFTRPENFHLTLRFIGEVDIPEAETLKKVMLDLAAQTSPFQLELGTVGTFPRQTKHIVWVGLRGQLSELNKLYRNLSSKLCSVNYHLEEKRYSPHITLGREMILEESWALVRDKVVVSPYSWEVTGITLLESTRINGGLAYAPLVKADFDGVNKVN